MRKKYPVLIIALIAFLSSCNKEEFHNTDEKVGISRVTFFPSLSINGDQYMAVPVGGIYTELGASAEEKGAEIPVTTSGTVDTQTPGVYTLVYSAVNKDGFPASLTRTVAVYETAEDAITNDFSGNYARTSNGVISTWTKLAPGVYVVVNPGGAAGATLTVIAFNPEGMAVFIPEQTADGSLTSSAEETPYSTTDPPQYSWKIINPGYGPALRTFIKQ